MIVDKAFCSLLLPEVLGFVPQFLLDDIVDTANDAVRQAVDAMEVFLRRWASEREDNVGTDWDSTHEVEQGLEEVREEERQFGYVRHYF